MANGTADSAGEGTKYRSTIANVHGGGEPGSDVEEPQLNAIWESASAGESLESPSDERLRDQRRLNFRLWAECDDDE